MLMTSDEEREDSLWITKVLLQFSMNGKEGSETEEYVFIQYMYVTFLMDMVDGTHEYVFYIVKKINNLIVQSGVFS